MRLFAKEVILPFAETISKRRAKSAGSNGYPSVTQEPLRSPMVGLVGRYVVGTGEELY
jgi:hypothetical protein